MMLLPASAEFTELCRSQITLLSRVLGAESAAVYLAETWTEQVLPKLVPIALYSAQMPQDEAHETSSQDDPAHASQLLPSWATAKPENTSSSRLLAAVDAMDQPLQAVTFPWQEQTFGLFDETVATETSDSPHRLALPLVHDGGVFGILICWRSNPPWTSVDQMHLETCAHSLALACVLDQRGQWLSTQLSSLDQIQDQQSDRFHELLHQLRNPLTALKTFGKLLNKRLPLEDPNQALVLNMLRESDRLQELLSYFDETLQAVDHHRDTVSISLPLLAPAQETSSGLLPEDASVGREVLSHFGGALNIQTYTVVDLLTPLQELFTPLAEAKGIEFHLFPPIAAKQIQADSRALTEILNNFLDNALKYAPTGSHVWLQWGLIHPQHPQKEGILVGDTGPGIPLADQPRIFERHYRGVQAMGTQEGSGLGLAIALDLIQEMKGEVAVYSPLHTLPWPLPSEIKVSSTTAGTAFVIWLPTGNELTTD